MYGYKAPLLRIPRRVSVSVLRLPRPKYIFISYCANFSLTQLFINFYYRKVRFNVDHATPPSLNRPTFRSGTQVGMPDRTGDHGLARRATRGVRPLRARGTTPTSRTQEDIRQAVTEIGRDINLDHLVPDNNSEAVNEPPLPDLGKLRSTLRLHQRQRARPSRHRPSLKSSYEVLKITLTAQQLLF